MNLKKVLFGIFDHLGFQERKKNLLWKAKTKCYLWASVHDTWWLESIDHYFFVCFLIEHLSLTLQTPTIWSLPLTTWIYRLLILLFLFLIPLLLNLLHLHRLLWNFRFFGSQSYLRFNANVCIMRKFLYTDFRTMAHRSVTLSLKWLLGAYYAEYSALFFQKLLARNSGCIFRCAVASL